MRQRRKTSLAPMHVRIGAVVLLNELVVHPRNLCWAAEAQGALVKALHRTEVAGRS